MMFYTRLDKRIFKLLFLLAIFNVGAIAQNRTWQKFSPVTNDWTVMAPGAMIADAEAMKTNSNKGSHIYNDYYGFFAVIYRDAPKRRYYPWKLDKEDYFDKNAKNAAKAAKGEIIKSAAFSRGEISGKEYYIKMPNIKVQAPESPTKTSYRVERLRMFFDEKRFYMVVVVLPEEEIDSAEASNYLDSFVLN